MSGQYIAPQSIAVSYSGTSSFSPAYQPAQKQFVLDKTNSSYVRNATLTSDSLYLQYFTSSVVISLANLYAVAASANPALSWAPVVVINPTASTVTHPTAAYFSVSASQAPNSFTTMSYQWFSSSYSQSLSGSFSPLTSSTNYYNVTTTNLTVATTSVAMNQSQYFCNVSNISGVTTSTAALLTVN